MAKPIETSVELKTVRKGIHELKEKFKKIGAKKHSKSETPKIPQKQP